ncbi:MULTISPECIES: helix-turn-helix domain-containing protein [Helicobacter]|uniref:helix-turn-helix domain-containing protein n=1 Tax=Helicobacter TaxID=209 RepID=UPI002613FB8F|nr:helix-turn-helix domain-containing protein [Helicobacter sp. UBA3407]
MIIHSNPQNNFTKISNAFIQDSNISAEAKMVGILLMSYPSDWIVNVAHLSKTLGKGVATIRKALKELIQTGKLTISEQERDEKGRFTKDEKIYEFVGEVACENLAELSTKEFLELKNRNIEQSTENKESLPRDDFTDSGDFDTHIKNNILNKEKIYIVRDSKKHILLNSLFKIPKQSLSLDFSSLNADDKKAYEEFIRYREETRKLSISTKKSILEKLKKLKGQGENIIAVVERSIENGWSGLFPLPRNQRTQRTQAQRQTQETQYTQEKSAEMTLHNELLNLLLLANPSFSLERFKEGKIETATHRDLGFIGIHKEQGLLRLCDKSQEARYLQRLRGNVAQEA